ncbi:MAG: flippase-like domain-containing protein [Clostridia bacterium]|nr:flippase-like domain-containing protein [Clostridia bacterium]
MKKSTKKHLLNFAVLFILIALTLVILFTSNKELNFGDIFEFLQKSNVVYLLLAVACMLGYILFEGLSLHVICHTVGHKCKPVQSLVYATADVYYSAITPSAAGGQPASAYYMVKDGMSGGSATFTLVFNIIAYTAAIIVLGIAAFIIAPGIFGGFEFFVKLLIILGLVVQALLLAFFIACMFCHQAVLKCGNGVITFLKKIKLVRNDEKWRGRLSNVVDKYKGSVHDMRNHRALFFIALLFNVLQRASQMLVTCFVCLAVAPDASFMELFAMQAFVTLGYNSIPLPGGVGAFEYLYMNIFSARFESAFILAAMMVTRAISYYISLALSGVITLTYHVVKLKKDSKAPPVEEEEDAQVENPSPEQMQTEESSPEKTEEGAQVENPSPEQIQTEESSPEKTEEGVQTEESSPEKTEEGVQAENLSPEQIQTEESSPEKTEE